MDVNKDLAQANSTLLHKPKRCHLILIIRDCSICVSQYLAMCGDIFYLLWWEGTSGSGVKDRDATQHPTMHRTDPST